MKQSLKNKRFFLNRFVVCCTLLLTGFALARLPQKGESVLVELHSGISQKATFLGVESDTVFLGGYIKNELSIVKVPVTSFKTIRSAQGENLRLEDSLSEQTLSFVNSDSLNTKDSATLTPSNNQVSPSDSVMPELSALPDNSALKLSTFIIPFNRRPIDSTFALSSETLIFSLLHEAKKNPKMLRDDFLEGCRDPGCFREKIKELPDSLAEKINQDSLAVLFGEIQANHNDSLELTLLYFPTLQTEPEETKMYLAAKSPLLNTLQYNKLSNALNLLLKRDTIALSKTDTIYKNPNIGYIRVETDPEDAILSHAHGDAICRTPCAFATQDTGIVELYAYWEVHSEIWARNIRLRVLPGDTAKIATHLKRVKPSVTINSSPEKVDVFLPADSNDIFATSLGRTPTLLPVQNVGPTALHFSKAGFRDTTVHFYMMPSEKNKLNVTLQPLTLPADIEADQQKRRAQKHRKIGITLMGSAVIPAILGTTFILLGQKDYDEAERLKKELENPHVQNGEAYNKKLQKNKDRAERGDIRTGIGIAGLALSAGLLGVGFFIAF